LIRGFGAEGRTAEMSALRPHSGTENSSPNGNTGNQA
jgi:hypothetical protein